MKRALIMLLMVFIFMIGCRQERPNLEFKPNKPPSGKSMLAYTVYKTNWLVTLSIVGVAMFTFAFINGSKFGIPGIIACLAALVLSLGTIAYAKWMALFGCISGLILLTATIMLKQKAIRQIIIGAQNIKNRNNQDSYIKGSEILAKAQDKDVQRLVKVEKAKMKLKTEDMHNNGY